MQRKPPSLPAFDQLVRLGWDGETLEASVAATRAARAPAAAPAARGLAPGTARAAATMRYAAAAPMPSAMLPTHYHQYEGPGEAPLPPLTAPRMLSPAAPSDQQVPARPSCISGREDVPLCVAAACASVAAAAPCPTGGALLPLTSSGSSHEMALSTEIEMAPAPAAFSPPASHHAATPTTRPLSGGHAGAALHADKRAKQQQLPTKPRRASRWSEAHLAPVLAAGA